LFFFSRSICEGANALVQIPEVAFV